MYEYVFLDISHSNNKHKGDLSQKLEAAGHKVWLAQDAGDEAQDQRQTEFVIERSDALVLVLSPETVALDGLARRVAVAQAADKPIFLARWQPVSLPEQLEADLADRPLVDLSADFEAGCAELLALLAGEGGAAADEEAVSVFGGENFGEVPALPGERSVWSESGYYWFKSWKTLVRILAILTDQRLIIFWDARDIWKWKPREADDLEEAFPLIISLPAITEIGQVYQPKKFLVFAAAKPYVDIEDNQGQRHRFSLQNDFEAHIDTLRDAVSRAGR